jgi:hypothetical protein
MQKLKLIEWIQLFFMFLVILIIMGIGGQLTSPNEWLAGLSNSTSYTCYSILYFDSSSSPYVCAICKIPEAFPEILRVAPKQPATFTSNHLTDIVALIIVTIGGTISWGLYARKILSRYVPWL